MPAIRIAAWLAAALTCFVQTARAQQPLGNDALRSEVIGSTVQIDAPFGYKIPMQFRDDGTVHGTANGLAFYLGSATDQGRWWITNGKLCTRWKQWFDREDNCITIRRQARDEFAWVNDRGKTGTGRVIERRPVAIASPGTPPGPSGSSTSQRSSEAGVVSREARATTAVPSREAESPPAMSATAPSPITPSPREKAAASRQPDRSRVTSAAPNAAKPDVIGSASARAALGGPVASARPPSATALTPSSADGPGRAAPSPAAPADKATPDQRTARPVPNSARIAARPEPEKIPQKLFRVVNVDADDELFMRAEPNVGAPIVGAIPPGGRGVRALGPCDNAWCPVSFAGRTGWAHGAYLIADGG